MWRGIREHSTPSSVPRVRAPVDPHPLASTIIARFGTNGYLAIWLKPPHPPHCNPSYTRCQKPRSTQRVWNFPLKKSVSLHMKARPKLKELAEVLGKGIVLYIHPLTMYHTNFKKIKILQCCTYHTRHTYVWWKDTMKGMDGHHPHSLGGGPKWTLSILGRLHAFWYVRVT